MGNNIKLRNFQDAYYDGDIDCEHEGFCDWEQKIVNRVKEYNSYGWGIKKGELGYIEDYKDEWYLEILNKNNNVHIRNEIIELCE